MGVLQRLLGSLLLCTVFLCLVQGDVHYYDFVLKEANFTRLCMTKSMLVVNDSFPGPVIRVHKGDTVYVNVQNQGDYGLTIHWHGVHQPRNPWSDGPDDWTRASVHGAIVVMPSNETGFPFPEPDGEEILVFDSTYRWQVEYSKTYLLRLDKPWIFWLLLTSQSLGQYYMAARQFDSVMQHHQTFDKSNVTAILEYKGNYTPPAYPIFPSNLPSYEDLLPAREFTNQIKSLASKEHPINVPMNITAKMYISVEMNSGSVTATSDDVTVSLLASLNNISWVNPTTDVLLAYYRNISGFYASGSPDFPPYFYDFTSDNWIDNTAVTLKATKVKVQEYNEEVEIVFQGTNTINAAENHPMHLHGYSFYLVGSGFGNFDNETNPKTYDLVDPPKMTTISVPMEGWAAIRFKASYPGVWLWHCHLDRHLSWGMSFVMIVKDGGTPKTSMREPPPDMPPCTDSPTIRLRPSHKFSRTATIHTRY
ncbi:hypothetical protein ACLB2K_013306 [Fragaria x ananassa]